jgi:hypothetical protein
MPDWLLVIVLVFGYFFIGGVVATVSVLTDEDTDEQLFVLLIVGWALMVPAAIASDLTGRFYKFLKGRRRKK